MSLYCWVLLLAVIPPATPTSQNAPDALTSLGTQVADLMKRPGLKNSTARPFLEIIAKDLEVLDRSRKDRRVEIPDDYRQALEDHMKSLRSISAEAPSKKDLALLAGLAADVRAKAVFATSGGGAVRVHVGDKAIHNLAFSDDGRHIFAADDGTVVSWETKTGKQIWSSRLEGGMKISALATAFPDRLFAATKEGTVHLMSAADGKFRMKQRIEGGKVDFLVAKAELLVVCGQNGLLELLDGGDLKRVAGLSKPPQRLTSVDISQDEKWICAVAPEKGVIVWNLSGERKAKMLPQQNTPAFARFSSDSRRIYAVGGGGQVTEWDFHAEKILRSWDSGQRKILAMAISPNGKALATASVNSDNSGELRCWRLDQVQAGLLKEFRYTHAVYAMAFSPDGENLVTAHSGGYLEIFSRWIGKLTWSPFDPISVKISTFHGTNEEDKCSVFYVSAGHADAAGKPFPKVSSPTVHRLPAGEYFFWAKKGNVEWPRKFLSVDMQSRELDLNIP